MSMKMFSQSLCLYIEQFLYIKNTYVVCVCVCYERHAWIPLHAYSINWFIICHISHLVPIRTVYLFLLTLSPVSRQFCQFNRKVKLKKKFTYISVQMVTVEFRFQSNRVRKCQNVPIKWQQLLGKLVCDWSVVLRKENA